MTENSIYELTGTTALYEVLSIAPTATQREIRQSYYRLAVVYHPDKNPDGDAVFKEVCFAHSILSDPEQRAMYDSGTLRSDLENKARTYDPRMDSAVELSPEELRAFVDRVRQSQEATQQSKSSFEQRREEEMRRRAEYDVKNPIFRLEYERARRLRQEDLGTTCVSSFSPSTTNTEGGRPLTSSELLEGLLRREAEGYGMTSSTGNASGPAESRRTGNGFSYKQQMIAQYRATHDDETEKTVATMTSSVFSRTDTTTASKEKGSQLQYSDALEATLQTHANFDYRTYVEESRCDRAMVESAIMADALGEYDRHH